MIGPPMVPVRRVDRQRLLKELDRLLHWMAPARVLVLFAFHSVVFACCFLLSELIAGPPASATGLTELEIDAGAWVVTIQLAIGGLFHFYSGWWRYVSIADAIRQASGLSAALTVTLGLRLVVLATTLDWPLRRTRPEILVIDWALALIALFAARVVIRLLKDTLEGTVIVGPERRLLIIGADAAGEALAREIAQRPLGMRAVAFVDDRPVRWNAEIRGLKVLGPIADIASIADRTGATEALIAMPTASGRKVREIVRLLDSAHLKFRTIPSVDQLVKDNLVANLRPVNLEDLLRRGPITLDRASVSRLIRGSRVVITGAGGTIGAELARQILNLQPEVLYLVDHSEFALYEIARSLSASGSAPGQIHARLMDVRDPSIAHLLLEASPRFVFHTAAFKHVPLGEQNAVEYLSNNCIAAYRFAELCNQSGVERFVFVSTDKAIRPSSIMGASKRTAEIALLDLSTRCRMQVAIVRFGNVIGSSGSVVPLFVEQIAAGGPVTVTHPDATRYFIRTSEAVSLMLQAMTLTNEACVFTLDMGDPVRIVDLAHDLIRLSGQDKDIDVVFTGLRPGEKLAEDTRDTSEVGYPSIYPQILVTQPQRQSVAAIGAWLERASQLTARHCLTDVTTLLREIIPEFRAGAGADAAPVASTTADEPDGRWTRESPSAGSPSRRRSGSR